MTLTADDIYKKITKLSNEVKKDLRSKGIVAPVRYKNGTIGVGNFKIVKSKEGFYNIIDFRSDVVVGQINLPQSAALLANRLALGKQVDDNILHADRFYGHALFEETLQVQLANKKMQKNDVDAADVLFTKAKISKSKKENYKREILAGYEKLMRIR